MSVRIYGNREIKTLPGELTRPTSARVREALFNIWQGRISGCRWLDLCAGSGAMGAEALCRGAAEVIGIEKSGAACRVVKENWQKVAKANQRYDILKGNVAQPPEAIRPSFDLIYFDPPYAGGLYQSVLSWVSKSYLAPDGEIAVEYGGGYWQPSDLLGSTADRLEIVREKRYGSTHLVFFASTPPKS